MPRPVYVKPNRFLTSVSDRSAEIVKEIEHLVAGDDFGPATDLIGQYLEWRLRGAPEPEEWLDNHILSMLDTISGALSP